MTRKELFAQKLPAFREDIFRQIKDQWNALAKPLDGMGVFETVTSVIGAVQETPDWQIRPRGVVILCADNGVVARGISQSGQEVTRAVAKNMGKGMSPVCRMARASYTEVVAVDIGICSEKPIPGVLNRKVVPGTRDFLTEPAMSENEVLTAIETGIRLVEECRGKGLRILATGEMGIGNTTTSAAVTAALLNLPVEMAAGRGAGLDDAGLARKRQVIREAIMKYGFHTGDGISRDTLTEDNDDCRDSREARQEKTFAVLRCLGGLDIAGLCGVYIGGALFHVPVVVDGLISAAAALCAERLVPGTRRSMLASHIGEEPAMGYILKALDLEPVIHGGMKLGEGTGAVMLFPLLDMAEAVYRGSSSFEEIGVARYERYDV